jgi:hypothetical protein
MPLTHARLAVAILFAAVLAIVSTSCAAGAQTDTSSSVTITATDPPPQVSPYIGIASSGGSTMSCPSGKMIIGIGGTRLKFLQKVTPICGSFTKDGSTASSAPLDPTAINVGASGFKLECGRSRVVSKLRVAHHENTVTYPYLGAVEITCSSWNNWQWTTSGQQLLAMLNFESWQVKASVACGSANQPVKALRVRGTTSVKALSIICDEP